MVSVESEVIPKMHSKKNILIIGTIFILLTLNLSVITPAKTKTYNSIIYNLLSDAKSTTGEIPPINIFNGFNSDSLDNQIVIEDVPAYKWRHGCGPTAAGMIIGYWDGQGYDDLVSGDASSQTSGVNNMISSQGNYNDYCLPLDKGGPIKPDKSEPPEGDEHEDNCIADFMKTSQSARGSRYGWSYFSNVDNSLIDYVNFINPHCSCSASNLHWGSLTWENFCAEIDANRPVGLIVDTDGNGGTDHFVTGIGYAENKKYACYNTWDHSIHWFNFAKIKKGNPWGIYGATFFSIKGRNYKPNLPSDPSPENCKTRFSVTGNLQWIGGDPDGDVVSYDIYLEANNPNPTVLVSSNQKSTNFSPDYLEYDTTYYWRIVAKDDLDETEGPIWYFTTENLDPDDILDQQQMHWTTNYNVYNGYYGQSFKPTCQYLTHVSLLMSKIEEPSNDFIFYIRNNLDGANLCNVSKSAAEIPKDRHCVDFDFPDIEVTPGQTYYIVVYSKGEKREENGGVGPIKSYLCSIGTDTLYTNGMFYDSREGSNWESNKNIDLCFRTYGLNISKNFNLFVNIVGEGYVDINPELESYQNGDIVNLEAFADTGWAFDHWSGDISETTNPATITMNAEKNVNAHFIEDTEEIFYNLNINTIGNGSVNPSKGTHSYKKDSIVNLEAFASPGWTFDSWDGDFYDSGNPISIMIDSNKTVAANFIRNNIQIGFEIGRFHFKQFDVNVKINGNNYFSDINYTIDLKGGILGKINVSKNGKINDFYSQDGNNVFIEEYGIGFGRVKIKIEVEVLDEIFTKEAYGLIFGRTIIFIR